MIGNVLRLGEYLQNKGLNNENLFEKPECSSFKDKKEQCFEDEKELKKEAYISVDCEKIVISKVLQVKDKFNESKFRGLKKDMFFRDEYQDLWDKIERSAEYGITPFIIENQYDREEDKTKVRDLIKDMLTEEFKDEDFNFAIDKMKEKDVRVKLGKIGYTAVIESENNSNNISGVYNKVFNEIVDLKQLDNMGNIDSIENIEKTFIERREGKKLLSVCSGIKEFDNATGGFQYGATSLIVARPGHGKTAFMLNCALNNVIDNKKTVFISLEMTKAQVIDRLISLHSRIEYGNILNPTKLSEEEYEYVMEKFKEIKDWIKDEKLFIYAPDAMTVTDLALHLRYYIKKGCEVAYLDYAQLLRTSKGEILSDATEHRRAFKELREIIKKVNCEGNLAFIMAVQAGRTVELRNVEDRVPLMHDCEFSSSLEQDASLVVGIANMEKYIDDDPQHANVLVVEVSKNRFNDTCRFALSFKGGIQFVSNYRNEIDKDLDQWHEEEGFKSFMKKKENTKNEKNKVG